jgi:glyoxylase-like metal-dependent hydrolase (beta-lactamase superfamily II)
MLSIKQFTFNFIGENTYIVYDNESKEAVIIDAGNQFPEEDEALFNFIASHELKVIRLLNTHTHIDHILGNRACADKFNLLPEMHPEDLYTFQIMVKSGQQWGIDLSNSPKPKTSLQEYDEIIVGREKLQILFTPGHCKGHVSFYCAAQNFIISGDTIFMESIGRTDLPGGDMPTLLNSIQTKIYTLPPQTIIYSGHGDPTSVGFEMMHNPFIKG